MNKVLKCIDYIIILPAVAEVAFILFLLCVVTQLAYVLYFFTHIFSLSQKQHKYTATIPVSVIVCAKNESNNLLKNLPVILDQRYADEHNRQLFEVVVVNDASTDDTAEILQSLQRIYPHLRVVTIGADEERNFPGKKFALGRGVAAANNNVLLLTDADCEPAGTDWLRNMIRPFHEGKELVLGYGKYNRRGSILNAFIRWETVHTFLQLSSYAKAGRPYMAVGRNMACTKEAFLKAQATAQWSLLPSGDDDLLVRATGGRHNVAIVADGNAFTSTDAKDGWDEWKQQKQRHLSTGKYYKLLVKLLLGLYGFSHAFMWLLFIVLVFTPLWGMALGVMALRCIVYWLVWQRAACILQEKKLVRFFPLFDLGWSVYNVIFLPFILWKNKQQWT